MRIVHPTLLSAICPLVAALAMCLGCSGGQNTIEGAITFNGEPVEQGSVTFEPSSGTGPSAGGTIQNGRYKIDAEGVTPGEMIVRINAMRSTGKKIEAGPPEPPGTMVDEVKPFIPAVYNEQSTLKAEVKAGQMTQDFALESQPQR